MNTKFTAAAQAIAEHFKAAEAARGEPFRDTFTNPMCNDAVTPNFVGIPLALLRALSAAQEATASPVAEPVHLALKAAFLVGLAALIDRMTEDVDVPAKTRWKAWVEKEVDSIPDEMTGDQAIDSAIKFFNETDLAQPCPVDLVKVSDLPDIVVSSGVTGMSTWGVHSASHGFQKINPGDWVVFEGSRHSPRVYGNANFHANFEIVEP